MRKLFIILLLTFFISQNAFAKSLEENLNTLLDKSEIAKQAIVAISIKDLKTGKTVYEKNSNKLLHPASCLKLFTTNLAINTLGENYQFETLLYQKGKNLYLKLDADPYLTSKDLENLFKTVSKGRYNLFIDDYEIDKSYYGTGWMWDNFEYKYFPKQSIYALNRNTVEISITPDLKVYSDYPYERFEVSKNNSKEYLIEKKPWLDNQAIFISGDFKKEKKFEVPVSDPLKHFKYYLYKTAREKNIYFSHIGSINSVPSNAINKGKVERCLYEVISKINKESDNFAAEMLLKKIGKKALKEGSTQNGLEVYKKFYDISDVEIVDASGVSHNNLLSTDWIVQNLYTISKDKNFKKFKQTLAIPRQKGTLEYRLIPFKNRLYAKTGTISGVSGIEGYLETKKTNYCFSILIQNFKVKSKNAKSLEDDIIQTLSYY